MKDDHLYLAIAAALLLSLVGVVFLSAMGKPVPEILPYVATSAVGALAMAARGTNGNGSSTSSS